MAQSSIEEHFKTINKNTLTETLLKLEALSYFSSTETFLEAPLSIKHDYLWVMREFICSAKYINECLYTDAHN